MWRGGGGARARARAGPSRRGVPPRPRALLPPPCPRAPGRAKHLPTGKPLPFRDNTPIAAVATDYGAIVVRKDSPYKGLKDLLEAYKANPASVSVAGGSAVGGQD